MSEWVVPWIDFLRWQFVRDRAYKPGEEYHWATYDTAPLTPMTKPLKECRVSFWNQVAARLKNQEPWEVETAGEWGNDISWREIPKDADIKELVYAIDTWVGYDAGQDRNLIFPLDRFRELEKEGFIRELAPVVFSSHPTFNVSALMQKIAPKLVERLKELKIDALILTSI